MIPSTSSHSATSFPVQQLGLDSSHHSVDSAVLPVMSPVSSLDAVAHCSSSIRTATSDTMLLTLASGDNMSLGELNRSTRAVHLTSSGNVFKNTRSSKQHPPKTRIRRTQLKMLADNLSKFYAPSAAGNRRELLAQKRNAVLVECSARERQLEVIRKQVSLVEKRKKAELEVASAVSHTDVTEPDSQSVRTADAVTTDSVPKLKSAGVQFNAKMSRKLRRWKSKRKRYLVQHKQKLLHGSAEMSFHSESMFVHTV